MMDYITTTVRFHENEDPVRVYQIGDVEYEDDEIWVAIVRADEADSVLEAHREKASLIKGSFSLTDYPIEVIVLPQSDIDKGRVGRDWSSYDGYLVYHKDGRYTIRFDYWGDRLEF